MEEVGQSTGRARESVRWEVEEAMFGTPVGLAGGSPKRLAMERHDVVLLF
jgi:hypothetical protein